MLNLSELINAITIEGDILIRIYDHDLDDYSFEKYLDDFQDSDLWVYSYPVKYIYPIEDITHNRRHASVVIELAPED